MKKKGHTAHQENQNQTKGDLETTIHQLHETVNLFHQLANQLDRTRLNDLLQNYTNPRRVIWINLIAGLSRGIGLTIGTAIFLAILGFFLSQFISLPIIGEYIAHFINIIDSYRSSNFTNE